MEKEEEERVGGETMDDVIRTAKEVRRLIRGSSVTSCASSELVPLQEDRACDADFDWKSEISEIDFDDMRRQTDGDFRHLLQLTAIDDSCWSETRSMRRRSVLSTSPTSQHLDFDAWDWDDDDIVMVDVDSISADGERQWGEGVINNEEEEREQFSPDMKVVIKLGDLTMNNTNITL